MKSSGKTAFPLILIAGLLMFVPMFIMRQAGPVDFWWWMSINLTLLISAGLLTDSAFFPHLREDFHSRFLQKVLYGGLTAALLYFIFLLGGYLSGLMFHFAGEQINGVYGFRGNASSYRIFILMLLVIGPGEELFWRVYVQRNLEERFSPVAGYLLATVLYTGIHILTGNFMLIMAALVAGAFWGYLYYRYRSPLLNIISHIIWDISVFLIFPLN